MINYWKKRLELTDWDIISCEIDPNQVLYHDDCTLNEKFFIGISICKDTKSGIIYHDQPLYEEAIIHELLHVKYPHWSENKVNIETENMKNKYKEYRVKPNERKNELSRKYSPNKVSVDYMGETKIYDNVHHTNAFVNKIVKNSDEWDRICVNGLAVKWKSNNST